MAEFPTEVTEMVEELLDGVRKNNDNITSLIRNAVKDWATQNQLSAKQVKMLGDAADKTADITKHLGKGMQGLIKDLNSSTAEFTQLNGIVGSVGGVFTNLLNSIPLVGEFFGAVNEAAIQGLQMAISQTQQAFNAFQKLGKTGLIGEEGLSGFVQEVERSNIPLQDMQKMLVKNSESLAYIGGSALEGGKLFTNVIFQMQQGIGEPLRMLGYDIEDIGEAVVQFSTRQRKLGDWQEYDAIVLAEKTRDYVKELDLLGKLTGKSAEAVRADLDDQLRDSRWAAYLRKLENEGRGDMALKYQELAQILKEQSPELAKAMKDTAAGYYSTDTARRAAASGFVESFKDVNKILAQGGNALEGYNAIQEQARKNLDGAQQQMAMIVGDEGPFIPFNEQMKVGGRNMKDFNENVEDAGKQQTAQVDDVSSSTKALVDAQMSLERTVSRMNVAFADSIVAVGVINTFATSLDTFTLKIKTLLDELPSVRAEKLRAQIEQEHHYEQRMSELDKKFNRLNRELGNVNRGLDEINQLDSLSVEMAEKRRGLLDQQKRLVEEMATIERERKDIAVEQSAEYAKLRQQIEESKDIWDKALDHFKEPLNIMNAIINPTGAIGGFFGKMAGEKLHKKAEEKAEGIKIPGFLEWATKPFAPFIPGLRSKPKEEEKPTKPEAVTLQPQAAIEKQLDVGERSILATAGLHKEVRDLKERLVTGDIDRAEYNNQLSALTEQGRQALTLANIKQSTGGAPIARPEVPTTGETQPTATGTTGKTVPGTTSSTPLSVTQTTSAVESAEVAKDRQTKKDILDQSKQQTNSIKELSKKQDASTGILEDIKRGLWDLVKSIQAKG